MAERTGAGKSNARMTINDLRRLLKHNRPEFNKANRAEFVDAVPFIRNKQLVFRFQVKALTAGVQQYAQVLNFYKCDFSTEQDASHPVYLNVGGAAGTVYLSQLSASRNPVMVRCSCLDYSFTWGWYNQAHKALAGPNTYRYTRKTPPPPEGYPYRNPPKVPGWCKHLEQCVQFLEKQGIVAR